MEDKESLKSGALVSDLPDPVENQVNNLLADSVVSPGVVIGRILLTGDHLETQMLTFSTMKNMFIIYLLRMEKFLVGPLPDLIHNSGLQVHEDSPGHVLAGSGLVKEGGEAIVSGARGVSGQGAIRLKS